MARIGSTFTADQQFDPFTRMPAFLIGVCTAPVRPPHNIRNRVRRTGALFASSLLWQSARGLWSGPSLSAMKSSLCLDMVGDCRWRDAASFPAEPTQRLDTQPASTRDLGAQIEGSGGGQQFGCAVSAALRVVRRHTAVAFGFENYGVSTPITGYRHL